MNLLSILWVLTSFYSAGSDTGSTEQIDLCKIYGAIYIEEYPENAQFLVYEEESEAFAKILVFEEENKLFATENGKWYFTDNKDFARHTVYFVDRKRDADFSVYFTRFESFAGCQ